MSLKIEQSAKSAGPGWWEWSVWLEGTERELDRVGSVTYFLHDTFPKPVQVRKNRSQNFQLTQANPGAASSASGTAPATTTGSSDTAQPADEDSGGFPAWILIAVAVVVIGGAVVFFLVPRNTKKS